MEKRERLGSRLGFILLSAGCAIGIGNVWKFPYMAGQYGGGIFVLLYLFFLAVLGLPVLTMEFAIGRAAQKSPVRMYHALGAKRPWRVHGYATLIGNTVLMMFYTTVAGWMLKYFVSTASGELHAQVTAGMDAAAMREQFSAFFGRMLSEPWTMILFMAIVVVSSTLVLTFGVQKGLERVTKYMMLALIVIMLGLAVYSCFFIPNGGAGLRFYLLPSMERLNSVGFVNAVSGAMQQAFFTLSLGVGSMAIFGSYIGKDRALAGEALRVTVLDTAVALCSGLIIFPACFAYGIQPDAGPNLIFITLPHVFANMPGGRLIGSAFFVFMSFAALSTVLAVLENLIACLMDMTGWKRLTSCLVVGGGILALSLPCIFGYNIWSAFQPFGAGSTILDLEDFVVSNLLLPLGALIFALFCTCRYGWGWKNFFEEANTGKGAKLKKWMKPYMCYVLPVVIVAVFVASLISFFA